MSKLVVDSGDLAKWDDADKHGRALSEAKDAVRVLERKIDNEPHGTSRSPRSSASCARSLPSRKFGTLRRARPRGPETCGLRPSPGYTTRT
jgi:hypothetical protein